MKRIRPRLAQALDRATFALVAVPVALRLAAAIAGGGPSLARAAELSQAAFGLAGACLLASLFVARGIARPAGVAVDKRSLFLGTPERQRRIPRWQVDTATVRPPDRRTVRVGLATGEIFLLRMSDEAEARSLAAILAAAPRRRRSDDD